MCGEVEGGKIEKEKERVSLGGLKNGRMRTGGRSSHERSWKAWRTGGKPSWDHTLSLTSLIDCLCRITNFFPSLLAPFTPPKSLSHFLRRQSSLGWRWEEGRKGDVQKQLPFSWAHYNIKERLNDHISEAFPKYTAPCSPKGLQDNSTPCPLQWMWLQLPTGDPQLLTPARPLSCQFFIELGKKGIRFKAVMLDIISISGCLSVKTLCLITWLRLLSEGQNWIHFIMFKEGVFLK